MKKFLLSFLTLILAGAMVVALILPLASVQTKNKETGKDVSQYAQSITMMDFIQSIFANDEKKADAKKQLVAKEAEITQEVTKEVANGTVKAEDSAKEIATRVQNSKERALYDTYNFATEENLVSYGTSGDENLIIKTKTVGGLSIAFIACVALVVVFNALTLIIGSSKLRGLGSFFTFLACALSIAIVVVLEIAFSATGLLNVLYAKVKWFGYIIIAYTAMYFVLRLLVNNKLKKM